MQCTRVVCRHRARCVLGFYGASVAACHRKEGRCRSAVRVHADGGRSLPEPGLPSQPSRCPRGSGTEGRLPALLPGTALHWAGSRAATQPKCSPPPSSDPAIDRDRRTDARCLTRVVQVQHWMVLVMLALSISAPLSAADVPCAFAEDLRGAECFGLRAVAGVASENACRAACCSQSNCTVWQYCGDFTTYCGSEHGGCYIGDGASHCQRSRHCAGLDCWDGGCRGDRCPVIPPAPPPAPQPPPTCGGGAGPPCVITLSELGLRFDGIGGITSNGECRLLYDYPEPQRSELLDYLFLPKFGLSTQILKVEIGSDAQSTVGTEPSYQHTEGIISYDRGIQFWFMREAKKRNPEIVIAALEWSAPSWVGSPVPEYGCPGWDGCAFFTDKNIDYILGWMHGAINVWGIDRIDYVGVWNEPPIPYIPPAWLIQLRARLDQAGYNSTQLVAPDASSTGSQVLSPRPYAQTHVLVYIYIYAPVLMF